MQKIKSLLGELKNPKINQDVERLLTEVKIIIAKYTKRQIVHYVGHLGRTLLLLVALVLRWKH